jgi:hypothetical protein
MVAALTIRSRGTPVLAILKQASGRGVPLTQALGRGENSCMKSDNLPLSVVAAVAIGIVQFIAMIYFWNVMTLYVQHVPWLVAHGVTGSSLKAFLFVFDTAINLLLCLPAAFALCALRPQRLAIYLAAAVIPSFVWQYRLFFSDSAPIDNWTIFIPGALVAALTLPFAVLVVRLLASRRAT